MTSFTITNKQTNKQTNKNPPGGVKYNIQGFLILRSKCTIPHETHES
jgi:hypothetical protein